MLPISDGELKTRRRPFINIALIVLCAGVFIYELTLGSEGRAIFFYQFGLIPKELVYGISYTLLGTNGGTVAIGTPVSDWLTMLTSIFIHADWMHFLFNMVFLWVFGDNVEDRFGHIPYLLFYLAAGAAASWLQIATNTSSQVPTIGASGAIAGVLGAYLLLYPRSRVSTVVFFFFITVIKIRAVWLLGVWFLIQFFACVL